MSRPGMDARVLTPMELAERRAVTIESITNDYEAGRLQQGRNVHPVKRLDDDWDPETGIENANMMRLLAERLLIQGYTVVFDPNVIRETIIAAADNIKRPGG